MLHKTAKDRYEKFKGSFHRLMTDFTVNNLDDFIAVANSLPEWIKRDTSLSAEQKAEALRFTIPNGIDWQILNQIANSQKHAGPQRNGTPFVKSVQTVEGGEAGFVVPGITRVYGAGDEILFRIDGGVHPASGFVVRTFRFFHYVFEVMPTPVSERNFSGLADILAACA